MIVVAAFKYLTSGGGDSVKDAHKMLIYAVVAIIIAFLAKGFVTVVEGLVGVSSTGSSVPTSPPPTTPPPATPPPAPPISGGGSGSSRPGIGYFEISDPRVSLADTELLISLCPAVNDRSRPAVKINGSLAQLGGSGDVIEGLSWDTHIVDLGDDESIEVSVQRCPGDEYKPVVWANDEYYY
ncbi:MAG: hypothetical protein COU11_01835 [Candidatus Harrisonbacteria bacterium CG10_big_fil_rev_8_21_14_0_10_49_15]|uniref:Uncharacterized protein n=1 Tax=Candidatus Harrisonbacteria bacterium CG10_big_fil_rev_8_21_14_0_10_49_15 TaxID=1974587 RepID=A0A2H0ULB1_9BACT|nr:MAG: hypothetical protein COU11_01835 [Candidatus Harrisonbacteria bacterium CG10_big_fil_rev_8_21_14_0_10_49_15]